MTQEELFVITLKDLKVDYEVRYTIGREWQHHYYLTTSSPIKQTNIEGMPGHSFVLTFDKEGKLVKTGLQHA